ncbi:type 1 glutamine amidotransferase domain-containing protein [Nostoc sp. NIES-2111]
MKHVLIVTTNHGSIDGEPVTGVWFSEFAEPFEVLREAGLQITVASPLGGPAPVDPRGFPSAAEIAAARDALERLNATRPLAKLKADDYDALFFPGGHGPMFDLATDARTKSLIAAFWQAGKPLAAVCHGPAALLDVPLDGGLTLLRGRRVTAFTRGEDAADALFAHMPFSLQSRMLAEGALFIEQPPRSIHVEIDGLLVTGQNPASARATASALLSLLSGAV